MPVDVPAGAEERQPAEAARGVVDDPVPLLGAVPDGGRTVLTDAQVEHVGIFVVVVAREARARKHDLGWDRQRDAGTAVRRPQWIGHNGPFRFA